MTDKGRAVLEELERAVTRDLQRFVPDAGVAGLWEHSHEAVLGPWLNPTYRIGISLPRLANETLAGTKPFGIDVLALARAALEEADSEAAATWGDTHVFDPIHVLDHAQVPAVPVSGDADCVRCTVSYAAIADECSRGSVARYVWDLADRTAGGWVVPTGAAGAAGAVHHHDQLPLWAEGDLAPIVTDWDRLTAESSGSE